MHAKLLSMRRAAVLLALALAGCSTSPPVDGPLASVRADDIAPPREVFHEDSPYRLQNSMRGLRLAARTATWIDIDSNYCWDAARRQRVPVATHWPYVHRERFDDPSGRVSPDAAFADLTIPEVRRLRSDDPEPYRILTMVEMVRAAARLGLEGIEWEVKGGPAFERPSTYSRVLETANDVGIAINVKTLVHIGGKNAALRRLRAAKRAGAVTMLIRRGDQPAQITDSQSRYIDFVR